MLDQTWEQKPQISLVLTWRTSASLRSTIIREKNAKGGKNACLVMGRFGLRWYCAIGSGTGRKKSGVDHTSFMWIVSSRKKMGLSSFWSFDAWSLCLEHLDHSAWPIKTFVNRFRKKFWRTRKETFAKFSCERLYSSGIKNLQAILFRDCNCSVKKFQLYFCQQQFNRIQL